MRSGRQSIERRRNVATIATLVICLAATALAYAIVRHEQLHEASHDFEHEARRVLQDAQRQIVQGLDVVYALEAYFSASEEVTREEFAIFAASINRTPNGLRVIQWMPRVPQAERAAFEADIARLHPGFQITERLPDGTLARARDRAWYTPIAFLEPIAGNEVALGFDPTADPVRWKTFERAAAENRLILSQRIILLQDGQTSYAVAAVMPVADPKQPDRIAGYVAAILDIQTIGNLVPRGQENDLPEPDITVLDASAPVDQQLLYSTMAPTSVLTTMAAFDTVPHQQLELDVGGRRWVVYATVPEAALTPAPSAAAYTTLATGFVLSLLLAAYIRLALFEAVRIDQQVHERTGELAATNSQLRDAIETREAAEAALKYERERLRAILDSTINAVMIVGIDGRIREANPATAKMFDYSIDELNGMMATDTLADEYARQYMEYLRRYVEEGFREVIGRGLEVYSRRKDGSLFQALITINDSVVGDEICFVVVVTDIDGQRETERERDLFFALSKDLFCILDATNVIRQVSPSWLKLLGLADSELTGRDLPSLLHPDDRASIESTLASLRAGGELVSLVARLRTAGGSYRWIAWSATWVAEQKQVFATGQDFDDQYRASERLKAVLSELGAANHLLQQANDELSTFAHIVSHDLKAPLRGITTVAGWLRSDHAESLSEDGRRQVDLLISRSTALNRLIDGVLRYSKVTRDDGERTQVHLGEAAQAAVNLLEIPPTIRVTIAPGLPVVVFDPTRLQQVFLNLVSNAVSCHDKPTGEVRIYPETIGGERCVVVADDGPGIAPQDQERIFQIFQSARTGGGEGSGIGLAVVRTIMSRWGGRVRVESALGAGARFILVLPAPRDSELPDGQSADMVYDPPTAHPAAKP